MLQLRLADGIEFESFARQMGLDPRELYGDVLSRLSDLGLVHLDQRGFRLTENGINVADAIAGELVEA